VSKITESARGEACTIRLVGICNFDPATTVWCHANGSAAGKGIGMKSHDLLGAYGCSACHDAYDRRSLTSARYSREQVELAFWQGHARSLLLLIEKGIVAMNRGKALIAA
jgi:putative nuclease YbcO-like protein